MQVTVEDVNTLSKKIKVVLPPDVVEAKLSAAFDALKNDVSIKGFRKGKVPRKFLEKSYGSQVKQEVAEKLVQDTYFEALEQCGLDAVVHPQVSKTDYEADNSFTYVAEIDVRPEFELGQYKGLTIEMPEIVADDEIVEKALDQLRLRNAPLRSVADRASQQGDIVTIDFKGYHDGKAMSQVSGENYTVDIGSGKNGIEFEGQMIGLKPGEQATRLIAFPAGFANPLLAGKEIEFRITVADLKERVLPELDDEFAKDIDAQFSTLAELKEHIRAEHVKKMEERQKGDLADKLMEKIIGSHEFEIPNRLVIYEAEMLVKETEQNLINQGITIESAGLSRDQLAQNYREPAARRVKGDFIIKKIAAAENLTLSEEDIAQGFGRVAQQYNMKIDEVKQYFRNREYLMPFMNELLNEKVIDYLRDNTEIKRVPAGETAVTEEAAAE